MSKYEEPVLILESGLDLKHFSSIIEKDNINPIYVSTEDEFITKFRDEKYSALIISVTDIEKFNSEIFNTISLSINIFTPVLIASAINDNEFFESILKYNFEYISYPFTGEEFLFRLRNSIRNKQNDQAIHEKLIKYKTLFDGLPVGIIQTDQRGNFTMINPSFCHILDMKEADIMKENFFQLCHPDDYFIERKQLDRLMRKEADRVNYEIRLINDDGKTSVCKIVATALWEKDNNFNLFTFSVERITV